MRSITVMVASLFSALAAGPHPRRALTLMPRSGVTGLHSAWPQAPLAVHCRVPGRSPADLFPLQLIVEPGRERREVVEDRGCVHLPRSGERFERVRPRMREAHREHR